MFKTGSLMLIATIFVLFGSQLAQPPQDETKKPAKQPSTAASQQPVSQTVTQTELTRDLSNAELAK